MGCKRIDLGLGLGFVLSYFGDNRVAQGDGRIKMVRGFVRISVPFLILVSKKLGEKTACGNAVIDLLRILKLFREDSLP